MVSAAHDLRQVRREGGRATPLERAVNNANQASLLRAALMPRWRVDYIDRVRMTLGSGRGTGREECDSQGGQDLQHPACAAEQDYCHEDQ